MEHPSSNQCPKRLKLPVNIGGLGFNIQKLNGCAIREFDKVSYINMGGFNRIKESIKSMLRQSAPNIFTISGYEASNPYQIEACRKGQLNWQPFVVFSDHAASKPNPPNRDIAIGGSALAEFIKENNLGVLHESSPRKSWTGNTIIVWLWEVDYEALTTLLNKWNDEDDAKAAADKAALDALSGAGMATSEAGSQAPSGDQNQVGDQCTEPQVRVEVQL